MIKDDLGLDGYFSHWSIIRRGLISLIDKFNDEKLDYVPFPSAWSAREIVLHIANAEEGWFKFAVMHEMNQWPDEYQTEDFLSVQSIKDILVEVHQQTEIYLSRWSGSDLKKRIDLPWGETAPLNWIIWHVIEHEIHHRGELSLILGLLGKEGLEV
ncbi:MAG: DinB family protein [Chloroflexota bacterium]|nr:MAG: DinB family protein [Chloroflexota bacterium]